MQKVVFEEPYEFVPPLHTNFWPALVQRFLSLYLRKAWSVTSVECRREELLRASLEAGHGILLAPNHSRLSDPMVLGKLGRAVGAHLFAMASWHLFKQDWFTAFMIRRMGAFSVYREGMDRQALSAAIEILEKAQRPLIIFPEGATSRHNDLLMALMDGPAMIARNAAKRRAKQSPPGKVVVHPVAIRYFFQGDLVATIKPILTEIERRLTWRSQRNVRLVDRVQHIALALLTLKEVEYFGEARRGDMYERVDALIDHLLVPLEEEWGVVGREAGIVGRVKQLRTAILPDLIEKEISEAERDRRWRQLADVYLAQQLAAYPRDYLQDGENLPERVLETVERFQEDLTDVTEYHGPVHAVIEVAEPIEVSPERVRKTEPDPLMQSIEQSLRAMLAKLAEESTPGTWSM